MAERRGGGAAGIRNVATIVVSLMSEIPARMIMISFAPYGVHLQHSEGDGLSLPLAMISFPPCGGHLQQYLWRQSTCLFSSTSTHQRCRFGWISGRSAPQPKAM